MSAYYNEIDPYAAAWLRNLISAGHVADGTVDERSIRDVQPEDLAGFTQCHFFAGIGVWSHALRLAGWPDDRPVWTGSCPCQPFSAAGKREGDQDERHLWPTWQRLICECRPAVVFGEQVAGGDGLAWLDLVLPDLEDDHYTVAAANLCAAGVGAPHIRQRLFFVAHAGRERGQPDGLDLGATPRNSGVEAREQRLRDDVGAVDLACGMADSACAGLGIGGRRGVHCGGPARGHADEHHEGRSTPGRMGDAAVSRPQGCDESGQRPDAQRATVKRAGEARELAYADGWNACAEWLQRSGQLGQQPQDGRAGFWSDCDWIACRDGKARPVEPGTFPLAHGAAARVGRLRAYGNAIVAPLAAEFVRAAA